VPTYEYACKQCGEHLDVVQRFTDEPLTTCPACAGSLRKVFGSIGISFKGSGFYKNDSRTSANGEKKKEPAAAEGGASGGSESSGTPKPDAPAKSETGGKSDGGKSDGAKSDGAKTASTKSDKPSSSTAAAS